MFYESRINTLDLSNFDTKKVTNMESMFHYSHAKTIDVSSFDTSNVKNTFNMIFYFIYFC